MGARWPAGSTEAPRVNADPPPVKYLSRNAATVAGRHCLENQMEKKVLRRPLKMVYIPQKPIYYFMKTKLIESFLRGNPNFCTSRPVGGALNLTSLFDQADTNNHNLLSAGAAENKNLKLWSLKKISFYWLLLLLLLSSLASNY